LEAAVIDNAAMDIGALDEGDHRNYRAVVAGPAALLVAKTHKISERQVDPRRLIDKDAHDIYRLLVACDTGRVATTLRMLSIDPLSKAVTLQAIDQLHLLFAAGPEALGSMMAGRAEEGIGDPANVSLSVSILASDLLNETRRPLVR